MPHRGWSVATIAAVAFLTTVDGTIVNVALPSIQRALGMSLPSAQWVVTAYLITFSAFMLTGGRVTDRYGAGRVLRAGLGIFTLASVLAGLSGDATVLLLSRAAQGAGAALALPAGLALAASGPTARERDALASVWMASLASALAAGPVLGGWISQHLGWHWIFLINLPAGLAGIVIAGRAADRTPRDGGARADWAGLICSVTALSAATFVLTDATTAGWTSPRVLLAAAVSAAAVAGLVRAERHAGRRGDTPMLSMPGGRVLGGVAVSVLWGAGVNGVFFCTSIFLQRDAGFSATRAGVVFVPAALLVILMTPLVPALAARLGPGLTVACGLLVVALGLAWLAVVVHPAARPGLAPLLAPAAVIGAGSALTVPLTTSVLASVPADRTGVASSVLSLARESSGLAGICVITLIVTAAGSGDGVGGFARGYGWGVLTAAAFALAGAVVALLTLPGGGYTPSADSSIGQD